MTKRRIVIVGAGIIGVCTAYYITRHPSYSCETHEIIILEAVRPACAASGKAGGLLSRSAFPQNIAALSFKLHEDLAKEHSGEAEYNYRRISALALQATTSRSQAKAKKPSARSPPSELDWVDNDLILDTQVLGGTDIYAQVHPYLFTAKMLKLALERGVELRLGQVTHIRGTRDRATGVVYVPPDPKDSEDSNGVEKKQLPVNLDADCVVLTAGPWSSTLLPSCPLMPLKAHSVQVVPPRKLSPYALFTDIQLSRFAFVSPEIYARKEEVFLASDAVPEKLPPRADLVVPDLPKCESLLQAASFLCPEIRAGTVTRRQACFLPVVDADMFTGPFLGQTDVPNLFMGTGHSCWGINNAPASGLILNELIMDGKASSVDISALQPAAHFLVGDDLSD